ncbi:MAG: ring-hydroxylating dioxygenase, large terminal subunit [Hyphomicrobiales bacterium]|jgi:phenylpropionate dioxygenase-like ring-hydroxylating dioxygenase large terminal subunit|nr:ring-hydroxylating dioxygenase, large terminal subunit [Hyphomicrobiales bacterium]
MKHEQNMLLTRTGAGEPMGELFRRYWLPIMHDRELPENDCPPVRVKVLSERLLAFRDSEGRLGLIDEFCAHRGVSLWFGRNEECGLRCPYHGWKFDVTGQCIEVPSEPAESGYAQKIKLKSYPLVERGGVLWTYMGPPEKQPELPGFEWGRLPASHLFFSKRIQECNYLQAMEGGIDSSHVSWLHKGDLHADKLHRATKGAAYQADVAPKFEVVESEGGLLIGARRNAEPGEYYWRITQWIMPWYTMVPPYGDNALNGHAWVPIDDENCLAWSFTYHPTRPLSDEEIEVMSQGGGIHVKYMPGTFRPLINKDNDYMIDRAAQKAGRTFSGVESIAMQDASVQESMGPISDRTRENLVSTDNAIIMARFRLRKAALDLQNGIEPPGTKPSCHAVRSAAFVLPADKPFQSERAEALVSREGVAHTSI